ncbi:IclR family transcriptional regulator [Paracoccus sp. P2]|uniref:IclR family transcriptional regulator n=1 Tax=Paracoccus sp. P2 TaxID=3248840 RepID=UPI00391FB0B7
MSDPRLDHDGEKYRAPALAKGLDILELLAADADGLTQVEIAKELGRTTPEIFRMLAVLRQRDYVWLDKDDRYHLSAKMLEVAYRHPPVQRLLSLSRVPMRQLAHQINQSVHMCILHAGRLLVVAQFDNPDLNINTVRLGAQIPIYDSASGRVLAAFMDQEERAHLLDLAGPEPADRRAQFLADLPKVRAVGYCEGPSMTIEGITNLSAPVFDFTGQAVAALTTPFIRRLTGDGLPLLAEARTTLTTTCAELSKKLGFAGKESVLD